MFPAFILSLSVFAGVLLDIQRHYGVTDSGIGLLQTGKPPPPALAKCILIQADDIYFAAL